MWRLDLRSPHNAHSVLLNDWYVVLLHRPQGVEDERVRLLSVWVIRQLACQNQYHTTVKVGSGSQLNNGGEHHCFTEFRSRQLRVIASPQEQSARCSPDTGATSGASPFVTAFGQDSCCHFQGILMRHRTREYAGPSSARKTSRCAKTLRRVEHARMSLGRTVCLYPKAADIECSTKQQHSLLSPSPEKTDIPCCEYPPIPRFIIAADFSERSRSAN